MINERWSSTSDGFSWCTLSNTPSCLRDMYPLMTPRCIRFNRYKTNYRIFYSTSWPLSREPFKPSLSLFYHKLKKSWKGSLTSSIHNFMKLMYHQILHMWSSNFFLNMFILPHFHFRTLPQLTLFLPDLSQRAPNFTLSTHPFLPLFSLLYTGIHQTPGPLSLWSSAFIGCS